MSNRRNVLTAATFLLLLSVAASASDFDPGKLQGLGDVRYHAFESVTLDRTMHIYVRLPEGYESGKDKRYPTVYLLDGGITFPLLSAYYRYLRLGEEIPAAILVGVAYGTDDWRKGNLRSTDYTAPSAEREHWGGAALFQRALDSDLLPLIENTYRAEPGRRIIFGQSLGGQFVLFTALTRPTLFWGHIASNPALHRNLEFYLANAPATVGNAQLFVASGALDDKTYRDPAIAWMKHWESRERKPWQLKTMTLNGHSHFSAAPASFRAGMRWLFD